MKLVEKIICVHILQALLLRLKILLLYFMQLVLRLSSQENSYQFGEDLAYEYIVIFKLHKGKKRTTLIVTSIWKTY